MDWEKIIYTAGGALLGYGIKQFEIRGKLRINNYKLEAKYWEKGGKTWLQTFYLIIEFYNSSGRAYQISDLKCELREKGLTSFLVFPDSPLPPSLTVEPKKIIIEKFKIQFDWETPFETDFFMYSDNGAFHISYEQNGKKKSFMIPVDKIDLSERGIKQHVL